ncbi:MAG: hypothetical protein IH969_02990, partial [Candidatus Krumholzibacteriota bacterium]|nr:hypothetical protein [Candidatus Krumholzibacteriota bacterium]
HYRSAETLGFLGLARAATGDRGGALKDFAGALEILIVRSRQMREAEGHQASRDRNLEHIIESYMSLLLEREGMPLEGLAGVDPVAKAFQLANVARSRGVQRALSASAARAALGNPDLAETVG